ncbi:phospholipid-transporting ATPase VD [Epargyreus clarus]|uniref:phospholipid-transporting ATPase VD n=1 Tax=Epargyreus clarus TaxID=520877 RepID=UPI003C2B388A
MSTEGSGETPSVVPSLPGAPEQTYLFPKAKGHSRSISHGGTPMLAGNPAAARPALKSAMRGHQRALSHGQIGEGPRAASGPGHSRTGSRTDFILPPGHRDAAPASALPRLASVRAHHSRQASRSDSIYTLRRPSVVGPWRRTVFWLMRRQQPAVDNRHLIVIPNHLVPDKTPPKDHPNGKRCDNKVRTTKYTLLSFIPKNLFEQFHRIANVYFIFIVLLNWVPALNAFGKEVAMLPVLFVLGVTAIKDLFEDRRRHLSDKRINNSFCRVYKKSVERYVRVKWRDVRVGDIVHLSNNEAIPADMVLLHSSNPLGICYLDTCNLDGETNLKQRVVVPGFREKRLEFSPLKFRSSVEVERPSTKIYRFTGTISHPNGGRVPLNSENLLLRECTLKNTDFVEGIVVYAGHETKAMLNNGGPRYKCSKLERKMNTDVIWCVLVLLFLCCAGAVGCKIWLEQYSSLTKSAPFILSTEKPAYEGLIIFWTYIIVLQVMIPVSLYVTIEMTKLLQVYHIHQDVEMYDPITNTRTECRALNITEELGQINYLFSDKTGTLTENKMVFRRCTVGGVDYDHPPGPPAEPSPDLPPIVTPITNVSPNRRMLQHLLDSNDAQHTQKVREFLLILAVCNTVVVSQPHVDDMQLSGSSAGDKFPAEKPSRSNGTLRSNDKYSRLTESRSTTPSPPPSTASPLRLRLPKLPFGSKDDNTSEPSTSTEVQLARFEAESPDELALAEAALAYGYELRSRAPDDVELGVRGELTRMRVLRVQQFDSNRKCMSVAMRLPGGQVVLYVKGADSTVLGALAPMRAGSPESAAYERTRTLLSEYSRAGLRTLVMAKRTMSPALWEEWLAGHTRASEIGEGRERRVRESLARLESALALVGATGVEDRLQAGVPRTVRALLDAGLAVWVLTGDKPDTAVNIAYSAALFSPTDRLLYLMSRDKDHAESTIKNYLEGGAAEGRAGRALVVDGRTLTYILDRRSGLVAPFLSLARRCSAVLCCRATPLQKAYIVKVPPPPLQLDRRSGLVAPFLSLARRCSAVLCCRATPLQKAYIVKVPPPPLQLDRRSGLVAPFLSLARRCSAVLCCRATPLQKAYIVKVPPPPLQLDRRSGLVAPFLSLARRCSAVLCCRATPLQKAYIVKAVKEELGVTTLAIGDGANDVSMIQTADVGVGLSGQEGRQAVMASDFALSSFKYLERLLLVHGHWCYDRLARMILYFFLKNATFVFLVFWYQLYCGFSSSVMIDQLHLMAYNLVFTAFPPIIIGAYDRAAPAALLLERPGLYGAARRGLAYRAHSYWAVLAESLYISLVVFFPCLAAHWDRDTDIWTFGLLNMTCCLVVMLVYVAIETRSWTIIHVLALTGSLGSFFVLTLAYQTVCVSCLGLPSTYRVMHHALADPLYWLVVALTTVAALAPRLAWRAARNSLRPGALRRAVLARRRAPYAAHYHTTTASAHVYRSTDEDGLQSTTSHAASVT